MQHEAVRVVHRYDRVARGSGFFVIDLMVLHTFISARRSSEALLMT